jgi:hypothetical protein
LSEQTPHRWRDQYSRRKVDGAKLLTDLEKENMRLNRMDEGQALDLNAMREVARASF